MNFKKILIFAILGPWSILSAFQASAMRAHLQRYASTVIMSSLPSPRNAENHAIQLLNPRVTICGYATLRKFKSNLPAETFPLKPDAEQQSPKETLFELQDKQAADLMDKVMDKKTRMKPIQEKFAELSLIQEQHPVLFKTVTDYKHTLSNVYKFTNDLTVLSEANQLPPHFKSRFDSHHDKLKRMSNDTLCSELFRIYWKL